MKFKCYIYGTVCISFQTPLPSVHEVKLLGEGSQGLLQDAGEEALLEHVQLHAALIPEPDALSVGVGVERVHQHKGHVAAIRLIQVLEGGKEQEETGAILAQIEYILVLHIICVVHMYIITNIVHVYMYT